MSEQVVSEGEASLLMTLPLLYKLVLQNRLENGVNLSKAQFLICAALATRPYLNMGQIADYIASSKEQATRVVAQLVKAGYVERFETPENRTHVYIRLTAEGLAYMQAYCKDFCATVDQKLDAALAPEEKETLILSLHTVFSILSKVI